MYIIHMILASQAGRVGKCTPAHDTGYTGPDPGGWPRIRMDMECQIHEEADAERLTFVGHLTLQNACR